VERRVFSLDVKHDHTSIGLFEFGDRATDTGAFAAAGRPDVSAVARQNALLLGVDPDFDTVMSIQQAEPRVPAEIQDARNVSAANKMDRGVRARSHPRGNQPLGGFLTQDRRLQAPMVAWQGLMASHCGDDELVPVCWLDGSA
jgi:hypothetical protein